MAVRCLTAILAFLAAAAPPALAETYKWVDDKGVVNYSNTPPPEQTAKRQVVGERLSVIAPDPSLGPAIAAMNARAARQAEYEEAEWAMRQRHMLAAQTSYPSPSLDCSYYSDCGMGYTPAYYYYPYAYGSAVFNAVTARRVARAEHYRPHVAHRGMGGMRGKGGTYGKGATHGKGAAYGNSGMQGKSAMHAGRGSFR